MLDRICGGASVIASTLERAGQDDCFFIRSEFDDGTAEYSPLNLQPEKEWTAQQMAYSILVSTVALTLCYAATHFISHQIYPMNNRVR